MHIRSALTTKTWATAPAHLHVILPRRQSVGHSSSYQMRPTISGHLCPAGCGQLTVDVEKQPFRVTATFDRILLRPHRISDSWEMSVIVNHWHAVASTLLPEADGLLYLSSKNADCRGTSNTLKFLTEEQTLWPRRITSV